MIYPTPHAPDEQQAAAAAQVQQAVASLQGERCGAVLAVLEQLQTQNPRNYLSADVLRAVARAMNLPLSQVFSVATFYAFFNLLPQGKHTIAICRGTACHTRGSRGLLETVERALGLTSGEHGSRTTEDAQFTVRTVACFGQCALAPVVELDRVIHGHMNDQKLLRAAEALEKVGGGGRSWR